MSRRDDKSRTTVSDLPEAVADVLAFHPAPIRAKLLELRQLILDVAARTPGVGPLEETLRWGVASYLTTQSGSGTTIRIDASDAAPHELRMFVSCRTSLVDAFNARYPTQLRYDGRRAIVLDSAAALPADELADCIELALTYKLDRRRR